MNGINNNPFDDDFDLLDRIEIPIKSSKEKDTFLEYMEEDQGYTKPEVEELDEYMTSQYGEYWSFEKEEPKSRWERFKERITRWFYGYNESEYERYKKSKAEERKPEFIVEESPLRKQRRSRRVEMRMERKEARQKMREDRRSENPKRKMSPKMKKALIIGVAVVGAAAVVYLIAKKRKR